MSNDTVIRATGLGKRYTIGHQSTDRQATLRDAISHNLANFARTTRDMLRGKPIIAGDEIEEFWALRDLNFEIKRGDVVGIIGRNGAGKSTLLKVLSRITEPSEGRVEIRGRVASLLEVGTGFHPELTGRENIFLNGAILGMTRGEIRLKFDEIVAFAGVEKFLDTPVKRYSSGMYVRLAFSVAAHLEPEILIVDEVLAVGDMEFQQKCLGKMQDVASTGRTVLFVSHNMATIESLCQRCLVLSGGAVAFDDNDVVQAIRQYNQLGRAPRGAFKQIENEAFTLKDMRIKNREAEDTTISLRRGEPAALEVQLSLERPVKSLNIGYAIYNAEEKPLWWSFFADLSGEIGLDSGQWELACDIPTDLLNDGTHRIEMIAAYHNGGWLIAPGQFEAVCEFDVLPAAIEPVLFSSAKRRPPLKPCLEWSVAEAPSNKTS